MPLTAKGDKIKREMEKEYGTEKGKEVFYAAQNKGTIKGTHKAGSAMDKFAEGFMEHMGMLGVPRDKAETMLKIAIFVDRLESNPNFANGATSILDKQAQFAGATIGKVPWGELSRLSKLMRPVRYVSRAIKAHPTATKRIAWGTGGTTATAIGARALGIGDKKSPPAPTPTTIFEDTEGAWNKLPTWGKGLAIGIPAVTIGAMIGHAITKKKRTAEEVAEEGQEY